MDEIQLEKIMREKILNYIKNEKGEFEKDINYCKFGKYIWQEAQKELLEELSKEYTVPLDFKIEQRLKELKGTNK